MQNKICCESSHSDLKNLLALHLTTLSFTGPDFIWSYNYSKGKKKACTGGPGADNCQHTCQVLIQGTFMCNEYEEQ